MDTSGIGQLSPAASIEPELTSTDMNNPSNLFYYSQLLLFKPDVSRSEIVFTGPDNLQRRTLHTLADNFGLEYEYSRLTTQVRVTRSEELDSINPERREGSTIDAPEASSLGAEDIGNGLSLSDYENLLPLPDSFTDVSHLSSAGAAPYYSHIRPAEGFDRLSNLPSLQSASDLEDYPSSNPASQLLFPGVVEELQSLLSPVSQHAEIEASCATQNQEIEVDQPSRGRSRQATIFPAQPAGRPLFTTPVDTPSNAFYYYHSPHEHSPRSPSRMSDSESFSRPRLPSDANQYGDISYLPQPSPSQANSSRSSPRGGSSPGRYGPLDFNVQENMRAVKAGGGSCWRCKILRKSCNPETPCVTCPSKDTRSNWGEIGCKRGTLKANMPSLNLCPQSDLEAVAPAPDLAKTSSSQTDLGKEPTQADANHSYWEIRNLRNKGDASNIIALGQILHSTLLSVYPESSSIMKQNIGVFPILKKRILGIMWSVHESSASKCVLVDDLKDIVPLLHVCGLYHIICNQVHPGAGYERLGRADITLISKSQKCLQVALDAMQIVDRGHVARATHESCQISKCDVNCISALTSCLEEFVDELYRVLFLKENMTQKSQWLDIFYSLCIQSYVRRILVHLSKRHDTSPNESTGNTTRFKEYLHLAIRLFTAASGTHDPLMQAHPSVSTESAGDQASDTYHYQEAQFVVKQHEWKALGIDSSYRYLKHIFEDTGGVLEGNANMPFDYTGHFFITRMSIDGITNPPLGGYQCTFASCTAQPFQTQYLLNSHANVHSQNRPHFCPVSGCPRSEGGKGFKRKNEMIRHGLVHDSPGYVCPFCPDREHKYPRPDNLERHVRVHHPEKDKDDPLLRDVLTQRPEGPSRGRRRRGTTG